MGSAQDPLASLGKTKMFASFWFLGTFLISAALAVTLCSIDAWMWKTKNPYLDMQAYKANRLAWSGVPQERLDPRKVAAEEAFHTLDKSK